MFVSVFFCLAESVGLPSWLTVLMSACLGSHDIHVTFVALETVLRLVELHHEASSAEQQLLPRLAESGNAMKLPTTSSAALNSLLTKEDVSCITAQTAFVQVSTILGYCNVLLVIGSRVVYRLHCLRAKTP